MPSTVARERNKAAVRRLFARDHVPSPAPWKCHTVHCADGTLPPGMHLSKQCELAHEVGRGTAAAVAVAAAAATSSPHSRAVDYGNPFCSCYSMNRKIARHEWATSRAEKGKLQGGPLNPHKSARERRAAIEHEEAILRYELSIPRRRVAGHLLHLTAAQLSTSQPMPRARTMDRLVEHRKGCWVLHNPYRQQLLRGEPVMTRIMHGEFYEPQRNEQNTINFSQANKRHVQVASSINHAMHSSRNTR
ncbi:uncharacterized protein TraAM80_02394 [Trypanosoma rangeli]|uniref:Uncharacterized protein n=1 Tax=Trypanosoma rangeli TaxID=5698 RepID=A0A422NUJ3_TRYRA|nr:uncharacterized protein TraAM80_02394 [Trypanosoma rangeli]RNF09135.1 uncharacterized protein TraAM80_02394 [Trypanosoma rangeli]|eukprot:RNF09135.1 uncharacterized protein TraAM80_02394 [Trypanosoma rangeli]